jgi:hypothetical protein
VSDLFYFTDRGGDCQINLIVEAPFDCYRKERQYIAEHMLKGQTEASKGRQMLLAQRHASLRSEPEWSIPHTPMEIATEVAKLVLEMRDNSRDAGAKKQRLELLAEHFLRITENRSQSDSIDSIEIGNRTPRVTLTM